jgi:GntR family transcriptional regulator
MAAARVPATPALTGTAPAHVEIERWLVAAIGRRELSVGDKLPPEAELASRIGVSRMTLRQALGRLEARGVITRRPGRLGGTFVAEPRIDVELTGWAGFTAELRKAQVRAGARVVVARTGPAPADVAAALGLGRAALVHEVARVRSAQRLPVALEQSWFPAETFPGLLEHRLTGSLYAVLRKAYGRRPHTADEFVDPVLADADAAGLLDLEPGRPLLRVERTAYTAAGLAVEFARDLFRTDRVRLHVRSDLG